jgi:DtxR family Mn-dependent transcriptional regulator
MNNTSVTGLSEVRTEAVEDLLKAVYTLQKEVDPVPTTLLAKTLNISPPSVTDMVKRLSESQNHPPLLDHKPYHGVRLTPLGEKVALEVIRHHRLLELYLSQALGYSWDEVHSEADRLEHVISEQLEARIAAALGNPKIDPHGDPIPTLEGKLPADKLLNLADLPTGRSATVSRISDQSPDVLRYLSDLGLTPGTPLHVIGRSPLKDTVTVEVGDKERTVGATIAQSVLVTPD